MWWDFRRDGIRQPFIFSRKHLCGHAQQQQQPWPGAEALQHPSATQTGGPENFQHLKVHSHCCYCVFKTYKQAHVKNKEGLSNTIP